jgi:hypothetical protein
LIGPLDEEPGQRSRTGAQVDGHRDVVRKDPIHRRNRRSGSVALIVRSHRAETSCTCRLVLRRELGQGHVRFCRVRSSHDSTLPKPRRLGTDWTMGAPDRGSGPTVRSPGRDVMAIAKRHANTAWGRQQRIRQTPPPPRSKAERRAQAVPLLARRTWAGRLGCGPTDPVEQ